MDEINSIANRVLRIAKVLTAPVEQVWQVWTDPEQIVQWWGPAIYFGTVKFLSSADGP